MDDFANASNLTSSAAARGLRSWCGRDGSWSFASAVGGFVSLMAVLAGCASSSPKMAELSGRWCRAINASAVLEITRFDVQGGLQVYGYCSGQTLCIGHHGAKILGIHPSDPNARGAAIR